MLRPGHPPRRSNSHCMPARRITNDASFALPLWRWLESSCLKTRPWNCTCCVSRLQGRDSHFLTPHVLSELSLISVPYTISPDGPRLDKTDCLGNWSWQEGSQQTLKCQAWGNPSPKLTCRRKADGALLPIGVVKSVTREMNGTYECRAFSSRGNVTRNVFLTVLCEYPRI